MSLVGAPIEAWEAAASRCRPEDIVDIADQIGLVEPAVRRGEIAAILGPIVAKRSSDGEIAPQLLEHWDVTTAQYIS